MEDQNTTGVIYEFHPDTEEIILCRYISLVEHFRTITTTQFEEERETAKQKMADLLSIPDEELNGLKALAMQAVYDKKQESTAVN